MIKETTKWLHDLNLTQNVHLAQPPSKPEPLHIQRLLLAHLGMSEISLTMSEDLITGLKHLDSLPTRDFVDVPVLFGKNGKTNLEEFMNPCTSTAFNSFVRSLGFPFNGHLYWADMTWEMQFLVHTPPTTANHLISIVWVEDDFELLQIPTTLPGSVVYLLVRPLPSTDAYQVRIIISVNQRLPENVHLLVMSFFMFPCLDVWSTSRWNGYCLSWFT